MKKIIFAICFFMSLVVVFPCFADVLTAEQMGYMTLESYGYYIGILGIICGFAFVLGIR